MASQGPLFVGTGADNNAVGILAWVSPGNITAEDSTYSLIADSSAGTKITHYLTGTNCGFTIPAGVTINGIVVEIKRFYTANGARTVADSAVRIIKGGVIGTTDRSSALNWPRTTNTYATYGSSSDLWGLTWLYSDINASNFGAALSVSATKTKANINLEVDAFRITVYYGASGSAIFFGQDF